MTTNAPNIAMRPATKDDEAFLRELFHDDRRATYDALPSENVREILDQQYDARREHYRRVYPQAEELIIEVDGTPCGRFLLDVDASALTVVDMAVKRAHRGRGISTAVLLHLQERAQSTNCRIELYVEQNNRARRLYARLGFREESGDGVFIAMAWRPKV